MTAETAVKAPAPQTAALETIYLTFGVKYEHEPHPYWSGANPNGWVVIRAKDHTAARRLAARYFGRSWSTTYDSLSFNAEEAQRLYYPLGAIAEITEDGATSLITGVEAPTPQITPSDPEYYGVDSKEVVGARIEGHLYEDPSDFYDVMIVHVSCVEDAYTRFKEVTEEDLKVRAFELDWSQPRLCDACRRSLT